MQYRYVIFIFFFLTVNCFSGNFYTPNNIDGLHLKYKFGFWLTSEAAVGDFSVKKVGKNEYIAKLVGETKGVVGFFLKYRKDVMISKMHFNKRLNKFVPENFIKKVIINKNLKESTYLFDYKNMRIIKKRHVVKYEQQSDSPDQEFLNNMDDSSGVKRIVKNSTYYIPLKSKNFEDYLTAAVNFITGRYKIPKKNETLKIRLFPEKNKKKRKRILLIHLLKKNENFYHIKADFNVDFISDKITKVFAKINRNMIPEKVMIPSSSLLGTIYAERIK